MHPLYDKTTGAQIGEITEPQLKFLQDQMEEESTEDRDYSITNLELDYFEGLGADPALVSMLRAALGERSELVIEWR